MNLRNVLRAYSLLRQLSDDETALLNILRTLNDSDREALMLSMSDKPQKKSSERVIDHCAVCDYTKRALLHKDPNISDYHEFQSSASSSKKVTGGGGRSKRGESLKGQLDNRRQGQRKAAANDDDNGFTPCQFIRSDGKYCLLLPDHNIHHLETADGYHSFVATDQPPASSAAGAGD